jgi:outer membrane protein OmpA-like peptidoglycan-associated protein
MISGERESIARAAPPGIASALGVEERAPSREYEVPRRERPLADAPPRTYGAEPVHKKSRIWPTVAVLGALALVWAIWPKGRHDTRVADTARSAYSGGEVVAPVVTPPAVPAVPSSPRLQLPNGTALMVAENGPEGRIVGILNDPSTPADEKTAFVLERIQFESNSANLRPESNAQIKDIASILAAYPNAAVQIGGHTDNTGNAAANLKLSRERAASVKRALVSEGVSASRVSAQGFGSKMPIASNASEEGRARNRRIALVVTKKQ